MMLADQRGVVRDVPLTLLRQAHFNKRVGPRSKRWMLEAIGGGLHHPDGNLDNGQAGYARLLELAGFMSCKQYRKFNPKHPEIRPSCNFYALCEPEIELTACTTDAQVEETVALRELANIPHPDSGVHPRPP